jgi:hypothetical protein
MFPKALKNGPVLSATGIGTAAFTARRMSTNRCSTSRPLMSRSVAMKYTLSSIADAPAWCICFA